jgi:cell wall-associated NlpC family hydrolase
MLMACCALSLSALTAAAQTATRPRAVGEPAAATTTTTTQPDGRARLENELRVVSIAEESEAEPLEDAAPSFVRGMGSIERVLLGEIEERLGTPYRMGSEGPTRYDCSGFVWSVFQSAGIGFERGSARTFWSQFEPVGEGEQYKFGTLVFFNGLRHVGIVADAEGFYHASSSKGVVYSRFGEYWSKRITGFRRVPVAAGGTFIASAGR